MKSSLSSSKLGVSSVDGKVAPLTKEGGETLPAEPEWLAKGKAMAAFRSPIAGNKDLENLVQGFQVSEEEQK